MQDTRQKGTAQTQADSMYFRGNLNNDFLKRNEVLSEYAALAANNGHCSLPSFTPNF